MTQGAMEGGAAMYRMYSMTQGAMEGGATFCCEKQFYPQMNANNNFFNAGKFCSSGISNADFNFTNNGFLCVHLRSSVD